MQLGSKTLVICVDRDNDLGEKASIETPIMGREESLSAATKLALVDSEDSDINAIFEGIKIYEGLKSDGEDAEIVLIAGDKNVGIVSDRRIGERLDIALSKSNADTAILVTDGAEDEWILPIIESRVKIDAVRRVVVKQSEPLESTFYVIKKTLEDPKFSRTFLPPIGLILFALSISLLLGHPGWAVGLILGLTGIFLVIKGFGFENVIGDFINVTKKSLYSGKVSFVTYICAIVLFLVGTLQGLTGRSYYYANLGEAEGYYILLSMVYIKWAVWWYVGAAVTPIAGKIISMLIERKRGAKQWAVLFSIIATGLVLWGGSDCIILLSEGYPFVGYQILLLSIVGAIIISLIGVGISLRLKSDIREKVEKSKGKGEEDVLGHREYK